MSRLDPVIVTKVPPDWGPISGVTELSEGSWGGRHSVMTQCGLHSVGSYTLKEKRLGPLEITNSFKYEKLIVTG